MQIRLSPVTTSNVVTYTVVINAPNPDQKLLPGMTANLVIYVEETNDVLTIPYKAVKFTPEAEYLAKMSEGTASAGNQAGRSGRYLRHHDSRSGKCTVKCLQARGRKELHLMQVPKCQLWYGSKMMWVSTLHRSDWALTTATMPR